MSAIFISFCLFLTAMFYIFVFWKIPNKRILFISVIIVTATAFLGSIVAGFTLFGLLYGMSVFSVFQGHGLFVLRVLKSAIGGFFEEFFRSVFAVIYAKAKFRYIKIENTESSAYVKILDNHILGLAFIYSGFECIRETRDVFSSITPEGIKNVIGVNAVSANSLAELPLFFVPVFFVGMVLRYYNHLRLLQFSIYSLASKKRLLFLLALSFHFLNNFAYNYAAKYTLQDFIIRLVLVEIVIVIVLTLLLKKLKLREQVIANSPN